ncbi:MAG: recombinase family protein, partial [Oscillospiraceae bacterium]|nr:recombinase family protein [Oscillospiraceae bacterium]
METAIYCRVSTEEQAQEGFSIRAQEQKLKEYARVKDWSIYKIYMDEGISGKNLTERPAIQEMLADVESGAVQNVLVFKIDRLTRSVGDLVYLTELFNNQNCAFNSLTESVDTQSESGRMFLRIIGIFAEF